MFQKVLFASLIAGLLLAPLLLSAQTQQRGQGVRPVTLPATTGKYYALLIGVQNYQSATINSLDYPLSDVEQVRQVLTTEYSFAPTDVTVLKNPNRATLLATLDQLADKLQSDDSLLLFYAGHGHWDEGRRQGYWLPSDAEKSNRANWISNGDLREAIRGLQARHILLISDACFSGSLFVSREAFTPSAAIKEVTKLPSRSAITSGALTTVPDRSVFVSYLVKRLRENREPYLIASDLFSQLRTPVINNSPNRQTPRYGVIQESGDEGGEFIFVRQTTTASVAVSPAIITETTSAPPKSKPPTSGKSPKSTTDITGEWNANLVFIDPSHKEATEEDTLIFFLKQEGNTITGMAYGRLYELFHSPESDKYFDVHGSLRGNQINLECVHVYTDEELREFNDDNELKGVKTITYTLSGVVNDSTMSGLSSVKAGKVQIHNSKWSANLKLSPKHAPIGFTAMSVQVSDTTTAVVPNATVTILLKGKTYQQVTNEYGDVDLSSVPCNGAIQFIVSAAHFKKLIVDGWLPCNESLIQHYFLPLEVGDGKESVQFQYKAKTTISK